MGEDYKLYANAYRKKLYANAYRKPERVEISRSCITKCNYDLSLY